ncbi:MAG: HesA/MoeB/ThiF family protein [Desulfatiglans sp.]|nr:HesA/MoeB/ThiF family protein [Desulfatiglans sp.]
MPAKIILIKDITGQVEILPDQAGRDRRVIREEKAQGIAQRHNMSLYEVYLTALKMEILPYRYIRNLDSITLNDQLTLARSGVCIIGAGGLGGQIILLLARLGIGNMIIVDGDNFDETNLNRQALSSTDSLCRPKALVAKEAVAKINPAVNVTAYNERLTKNNAKEIFFSSQVIVDALDNIPDRFILETTAKKIGIPLVHGAVAGFIGQVMTIFPDDAGIRNIYDKDRGAIPPEKNPALKLGVPAVTPAIIASYQVMETIKILLDRKRQLRNTMLYLDASKSEARKLIFQKE